MQKNTPWHGAVYALLSCDVEPSPLPPSSEAVGIDVGLTAFATLSDGTEIANPRHARSAQAVQRRAARRKQGGDGWREAVRPLHNAQAHVRNQRADFHHKMARALTYRYGLIAVEDLDVKALVSSILAKAVHDAGWTSYFDKLAHKAGCTGRALVRVNPAGTTQPCTTCGVLVPNDLRQRWHDRPDCDLSLGRDENAARNILRPGLSGAEPTRPGPARGSADAVCYS